MKNIVSLFKISMLIFISYTIAGCSAKSADKNTTLTSVEEITGTDDGEVASDKIVWMSFTQATEKCKTKPKKIFIDIYTDWCGWCKKMDASTFKDPAVVKYMNQKYYAVKMDAESKDSVTFRDHTFKYMPEYKANELAVSLLQGKMSYPTFVIMDENVTMLSPIAGFQTVEQVIPILKYFGENTYKNQNWQDYNDSLKKTN